MSRQDVKNKQNKNLYRFGALHVRNISETIRQKYTDGNLSNCLDLLDLLLQKHKEF